MCKHSQCTIALLVSDAQTDRGLSHSDKVSATPWLWRISRKTYYNTFAASAELAYGHVQPSQDAPKNIIDK